MTNNLKSHADKVAAELTPREKEVMGRRFNDPILDTRPSRPLTSREIAVIVGGLIGCLASFCKREDIESAIEFIHKYAKKYGAISEVLNTLDDLPPDFIKSDETR